MRLFMIHSQWLSSISYSVINYNHLAVLLGPQHLSTLKPEVCALWSASAPGSHHQTLCFCKFTFLDFTYKWYHIVSILLSSILCDQFSSLQLLSHVRLSETPWTAAHQTSLSITNSRSSLKLTCIESVMPSNHLILLSPSSLAFNFSQHQGLFKWVSSWHQVAKVLEFLDSHFCLYNFSLV